MKKLVFLTILLCFSAGVSFSLPTKVYLPVKFLCQAPQGNWSQPYQDACEEAAILMAVSYLENREIEKEELLEMVRFQKKQYGGHYDLDTKQIAQLIKDYYQYNNVKVLEGVTIEQLKQELAKKHVVIVPAAGRLLGNPYFTPPGPVYHNLIIKGYDDRTGEFITNDPGTKRGRNFRYKYDVLYNAIHDWPGEGQKNVVVLFP